MGLCIKLLFFGTLLLAAFLGYVHHELHRVGELPKLELDKWWGPGSPKKVDTSIRPFKIEFKDDMIADLKNRLSRVSSFAPLEGVGFEYGFNNDYLREVIEFWSKEYKFKEREAFLNKYPHFKTNIQGLDIHYIHVKPTVPSSIKVVPMLLSHGWPGSVREFYEIIPLLTTPRKDQDFVFEVIIPSIPGYGYSQAAAKPGFGADQVAVVFRNLMQRIGHKKYYLQGGDWGGAIIQAMGTFFPGEIYALHSNLPFVKSPLSVLQLLLGAIYSPLVVEDQYKDRMYPLSEKFMTFLEEFGYMHLQATKPDTVGVALRDSPAGLAAYILEKFSTWTDPAFRKLRDGGLTKRYTLTNLLDNIMIYWTTDSITSSMRLYSETFNKRFEALELDRQPVKVPTAVANFKYEITYSSERILSGKFVNLIQVSHFEDGGHFAAFQLPQVLADDIWSAIAKARRIENEKRKIVNEL